MNEQRSRELYGQYCDARILDLVQAQRLLRAGQEQQPPTRWALLSRLTWRRRARQEEARSASAAGPLAARR